MRLQNVIKIVPVILTLASAAEAQYLYMDSNGDGEVTTADRLISGEGAFVDVWLETNKNRDGASAAVGRDGEEPTLFSYELIIKATGGVVEWIDFTNTIQSFEYPFPTFKSSDEIYVGYGGTVPLAPGKYHLGRLTYRVKSGDPELSFAERSDLGPGLHTSFGSSVKGRDTDHTLKLTTSPVVDGKQAQYGDWSDISGLKAAGDARNAGAASAAAQPQFDVSIAANPANPHTTIWLTISRTGPAEIHIYDVLGRMVATLLSTRSLAAGRHSFAFPGHGQVQPKIASGIYFVRVSTKEGSKVLRTIVLK